MSHARIGDDHVNRPPGEEARAVRLLALGGVLQIVRDRNEWTVAEAAQQAGLAPMTWRRLEDGLPVRQKTHAALDQLLRLPFGAVKRALADDVLMLELVKRCGVDTRHVAEDQAADFLARFAQQMSTSSPRQDREALVSRALAPHPPAAPPLTDLELVNRVVEQLTQSPTQTPAVLALIDAATHAVPDLVKAAIRRVERP